MSLVTPLRERQRAGADFALARKGALIAARVGKGKTLTALAVADRSEARAVLVLCPLAVVGVWRREVAKHCPGSFRVVVLEKGSCADKAETARHELALAAARRERVMLVVNYDAAWRGELGKALLRQIWDLVIYDEGHRIKSASGIASRWCAKLCKVAKRRLGLTGTPCPHSPLDIYAQARAIDPAVYGFSFTAFRSRYAIVVTTPGFPKIVGWQNQEEYRTRFKSFAFEDMDAGDLDLPPVTSQVVPVTLEPKALRTYGQMEREFYAEVERGEVTASNALVKILRLQQIVSGVLPLDNGETEQISTAKRMALADLIEDMPPPLVVFGKFHSDLDTTAAVASIAGLTYHEVSGRLKDLTPHATMLDDTDVLGVQVQSGGLGIDLTRASLGIFYNLTHSLGDYQQCQGRLHRPGQKQHTHFLHLVATGTVDEAIMAALEAKRDVIETILYGRMRKAA